MDAELDRLVRLTAFEFLRVQSQLHEGALPWQLLQQGFDFNGERVPVLSMQGIFKPRILDAVPLSIRTTPAKVGVAPPYEDEIGEDGLLRYRYQGSDPNYRDNVWLRNAMALQVPLVYLHGIEPGWYHAEWPVFVVDDDPAGLTFTVAVDDPVALRSDIDLSAGAELRRAYAARQVRQRLHQASFRHRVLGAYKDSCAVCRLHHRVLLDAAHILPDSHPRGEPVVPNGLAMCKIHHAAFDSNILGVRPDLTVEIKSDVLAEIDGPMLLHGLQELHNTKLTIPRSDTLRPSVDRVEERYELFRRAG